MADFRERWRGKTPDDAAMGAFLAEADKAFFLWKAADAGCLSASAEYVAPAAGDFATGHIKSDGRPVMFVTAAAALDGIPRLRLVKTGQRWEHDDKDWPIVAGAIRF